MKLFMLRAIACSSLPLVAISSPGQSCRKYNDEGPMPAWVGAASPPAAADVLAAQLRPANTMAAISAEAHHLLEEGCILLAFW